MALCNTTCVPTTVTRWPQIFLDSLLIRGVSPDELVSLTSDTQILVSDNKKHATEQPDYDLNILRRKGTSNELETLRVIHFNRTTLLPYRQDIYDDQGRLATTTLYDDYKTFGDRQFPTVLTIKRPLEEFEVMMTINKLTVNQKMGRRSVRVEHSGRRAGAEDAVVRRGRLRTENKSRFWRSRSTDRRLAGTHDSPE